MANKELHARLSDDVWAIIEARIKEQPDLRPGQIVSQALRYWWDARKDRKRTAPPRRSK